MEPASWHGGRFNQLGNLFPKEESGLEILQQEGEPQLSQTLQKEGQAGCGSSSLERVDTSMA